MRALKAMIPPPARGVGVGVAVGVWVAVGVDVSVGVVVGAVVDDGVTVGGVVDVGANGVAVASATADAALAVGVIAGDEGIGSERLHDDTARTTHSPTSQRAPRDRTRNHRGEVVCGRVCLSDLGQDPLSILFAIGTSIPLQRLGRNWSGLTRHLSTVRTVAAPARGPQRP